VNRHSIFPSLFFVVHKNKSREEEIDISHKPIDTFNAIEHIPLTVFINQEFG
jgi:hypothetical protein